LWTPSDSCRVYFLAVGLCWTVSISELNPCSLQSKHEFTLTWETGSNAHQPQHINNSSA
jgi:hypothetical protein